MRNFVVNYRGGAISRGGLALVGRCLQTPSGTGPPRPIPFQFSITQGYILEFGDNYLRFVFQGGYVLENAVAITGISRASPAAVSVVGEPYSVGDWVFLSGVGGMTQVNGQTYIVASVGANSFTLDDLNGNPVNSTTFGVYTGGGSASRLYTIATPYAASDLPYLKFSQTADVMSLTCSNPITNTEYPPYDLSRLSGDDWTLVPTDFDAVIPPPATCSAASNAQAPTSGVNATFSYCVTAVDDLGNESVASPFASCHGADLQVEAGTNNVNWALVQGALYYNVYRAPVSVDNGTTQIPVPPGSIYGLVGSAFGNQFADTNVAPDLTQTPPTHSNPFAPGQILNIKVTVPGSGLTSITYAIESATGMDFDGTPLVIAGSLGGFTITNNGSGYQPGDTIELNGAAQAAGAITFSANPSVGDTITLNGVVWTFVSSLTGPNQTLVQGALIGTLNQLVAGLSASANAALTVASYSVDSTGEVLLIVYNVAGTVGNAYTLAASAASRSGATLTGGAGTGSSGSAATGNISFVSQPDSGSTITLDGVVWTFVTSGATGNQTNIQGSISATIAQLVTDLTASGNANIQLCTYAGGVGAGQVLNITYKTIGAVGNTWSYAASATSNGTAEAPTLIGGANGTSVPAATLNVGPETGTYPGVNAYFQQRHFFANSLNNPDTFWASQTGLYDNFDVSIPTVATDAITASPWTEEVNGIQWLIPMPGGLIAMTGLRAWQIIGEGSYQLNVQPVTPSTTQAQPQAFNGCSATIPPIVIDYDVLYVQAIGATTVFDLSWNFWVNIYTGNDLTILSSHLFLSRQIVQWAWARQFYKVVWACCDDGTLLSLTYLKEQNVTGWARSDTQGLVVGIASVTEPPVNAVYAIVQRFIQFPNQSGGIYFMERMDNRLWSTVEDAYAVDCGVSNPMLSPNAPIFATSGEGAAEFVLGGGYAFSAASVGQIIRMSGGIAKVTAFVSAQVVFGTWILGASAGPFGNPYAAPGSWTIAAPVTSLTAPHFAGMTTLVGLADGVPLTGLVASQPFGVITLPFVASNVKVGLGFTAQLQTVYLNGQDAVQGARKVVPAATVRVASSGPFQIGTNQPDGPALNPPQLAPLWTGLSPANPLNATGGQSPPVQYKSPGNATVTPLWTGDLRVEGLGAAWISKGQVAVQTSLPLALEVTAIMPEILSGDLGEMMARNQPRQDQSPPSPPQPNSSPGPWITSNGGRL